jgi:DNA-binding response OmpR family regulator
VQEHPEDSGLKAVLERNALEVFPARDVKHALRMIGEQIFSALVCDLHLPTAGDGFTLVNAMRHVHPKAVTLVISEYPALRESMASLVPQADEIIIAPTPLTDIARLLRNRLKNPGHRAITVRESPATILEKHSEPIIAEWLKRVKKGTQAASIKLSDHDRTGHLHALLREVITRLRAPRFEEGKAKVSLPARAHGLVRSGQGYSASMLVEESRILQVCIFKTLRNNLSAVDLALVLTDVMTIADEVDSQLTQTMSHFASALPAQATRKVSARRKAIKSALVARRRH